MACPMGLCDVETEQAHALLEGGALALRAGCQARQVVAGCYPARNMANVLLPQIAVNARGDGKRRQCVAQIFGCNPLAT